MAAPKHGGKRPGAGRPGGNAQYPARVVARVTERDEEWLAAVAKGMPQECAKTIARQYDLGVHSVIMHGASPHELAPVVQAYRDNRPTLRRAVLANPGRFA